MLTILDLEDIATARLQDAQMLHTAARYDGAYYLAGYSLELALKSIGFASPDSTRELLDAVSELMRAL